MKKILLLIAILISFALISCGDDKEKDEPVDEPVNLEELVVVNGLQRTGSISINTPLNQTTLGIICNVPE